MGTLKTRAPLVQIATKRKNHGGGTSWGGQVW
jgi:hypothetical protein